MLIHQFLIICFAQNDSNKRRLWISRDAINKLNDWADNKMEFSQHYKLSCEEYIDKTNDFLRIKYCPESYSKEYMKYINIILLTMYKMKYNDLSALAMYTAISIYKTDGFFCLDELTGTPKENLFGPRGIFQIKSKPKYEEAGKILLKPDFFVQKRSRFGRISIDAIKASINIMDNLLEFFDFDDCDAVSMVLEDNETFAVAEMDEIRMDLFSIYKELKIAYGIK